MKWKFTLLSGIVFMLLVIPVYSQENSWVKRVKSSISLFAGLNYEMYAGQFHESSTMPPSTHGRFLSAGHSFGFGYAYRIKEILEVFLNGRIRRVNLMIGKQGEELEGWTYHGGWRSYPLPYDIYYHGNSSLLQAGVKIITSKIIEYSIGASFNFGAYTLNLGSEDNSSSYSDVISDFASGFSFFAMIGLPVTSNNKIIFIPSFFVEYGGISISNIEINNYIWKGVTYIISQQMFGFKGLSVGVELKIPF